MGNPIPRFGKFLGESGCKIPLPTIGIIGIIETFILTAANCGN